MFLSYYLYVTEFNGTVIINAVPMSLAQLGLGDGGAPGIGATEGLGKAAILVTVIQKAPDNSVIGMCQGGNANVDCDTNVQSRKNLNAT